MSSNAAVTKQLPNRLMSANHRAWKRLQTTKPLPPIVRLPLLAQTIFIGRSQTAFFDWCQKRYGGMFVYRSIGYGAQLAITDPDLIKQIFTGDPDELRAGEANSFGDVLETVMGKHSLLLLDGQRHMNERKLILPAFHGERMRLYAEAIEQITHNAIESWPLDRPFSLLEETRKITFGVILRAVFGLEDQQKIHDFERPMSQMLDIGSSLEVMIPQLRGGKFGPFGRWNKFVRLRQTVNDLVRAEIDARRASSDVNRREDVLSMLLSARYEDGSAMTTDEIRNELMTMLIAGHETTATALAWTFDLLMHHPEKMQRLSRSLKEGDETYLKAVIKESLRLRPVIHQCSRMVKRDFELGGYTIPAGIVIAPNIYLANHSSQTYTEPESFQPERFLENAPGTYTWIPFGGGTRRCIGASFAEFEMAVVIKTMLERVKLVPMRLKPEKMITRNITTSPKHGVKVRVTFAG